MYRTAVFGIGYFLGPIHIVLLIVATFVLKNFYYHFEKCFLLSTNLLTKSESYPPFLARLCKELL